MWSVEFRNESSNAGDVCIFQLLTHAPAGTSPLVWLAKSAAPTTRVLFTWTEELQFYWRERDPLVNGPAAITASQLWPAERGLGNEVTLSRNRRGIYSFHDVREGPNPDRLYVVQDRTLLPHNHVEIGFALSGFPAHTVRAQPNLTAIFRPEVTYWIAFGTFEQGESMGLIEIAGGVPLPFGASASGRSLKATLHRDNSWTVKAVTRRRRTVDRKPPPSDRRSIRKAAP
jgi:hypothetical protein